MCEHRTYKTAEAIFKRVRVRRENNGGDEPN
jgi:hypothetical protein